MNDSRARLAIEQPGKPKLYQISALPGWEVAGTVTRGSSDTGALVRNLNTGIYAQANAGVIRALDQRKVLSALGQFSNAKKMEDGKRVNVYLDAVSLERASALGVGNVSEGIRKALETATELNDMNYEALLKRYLEHVRQCEGIDFTDRLNDEVASEVKFSDEEIAELRRLSRESE